LTKKNAKKQIEGAQGLRKIKKNNKPAVIKAVKQEVAVMTVQKHD
jgi:hypothetical protein